MVTATALALLWRMLSERRWKLEAVLALLIGLLFELLIIAATFSRFTSGKSIVNDKQLQFLVNTFSFHALALIMIHFFLRYHGATWSDLFGFERVRWRIFAAALATAIIVLPLALALNSLSAALLTRLRFQPVEQESMQALELSVTWGQRAVFAVAAVIVAPIVEETLFRGILYPALKQEGYPRLALFGSSIMFAAIHMNVMTFIPLFVLALAFVFLLELTDTLVAPIVAHSCFNGVNLLVYLNQTNITQWWNELLRSLKHALPV